MDNAAVAVAVDQESCVQRPEGITYVAASSEMIESVAYLLAQVVCHVCHKFHSRLQNVLDACFNRLRSPMYKDQLAQVLKITFVAMVDHTRPRFADHLWRCVLQSISTVTQQWSSLQHSSSTGPGKTSVEKKKSKNKQKPPMTTDDTYDAEEFRCMSQIFYVVCHKHFIDVCHAFYRCMSRTFYVVCHAFYIVCHNFFSSHVTSHTFYRCMPQIFYRCMSHHIYSIVACHKHIIAICYTFYLFKTIFYFSAEECCRKI